MRLPWLGVGILVACGASQPNVNGQDAATDDGGFGIDANTPEASLKAVIPSVVFVDGLVSGTTTSTAQKALELDDVRICIHDQSASDTTFLTAHALPFDRAMPLANYPGVQRGSGLDLGSIAAQAIDIDVYSAFDLRNDAAWSPDGAALCSKMSCNGTAPCVPHARLSVTLAGDVTVVALVDDGTTSVKTRVASFEDVTYGGSNSSVDGIYGTVIDFSDWHTGETIAAFYGNWKDASGTNVQLTNPLAKDSAASPGQITDSVVSYEALGIRFDQFSGQQPFDRFGQSLDSIAYVANAAVSPPVFYGVRQNFVFALVGDPNDPSTVNQDGGRNSLFDRKGLHVAAVPYATPRPK